MISVALVSGCSTTSVNETTNEVTAEARPTNVLPTNDSKQDNQTQGDSTFYEPSESPTVETSESLGVPNPEESALARQEPKTVESSAPEPSPTGLPAAPEGLSEATIEPEVVYDTVSFVDNLEQCKIPEYTWTGPHSKGFPIRNNDVPYQGQVNVAVIFIDFSNATSEGTRPISEYQKELNNAVAWSEFYSAGKMKYNIMLHPQWFRAPKEAQEYPIRKANVEHAAIQDWVSVADDYYDFSKSHFIYFIIPEKAHFELGADMYGVGKATTDEGPIERRVFTYYAPPKLIWSHMVHEVLHDQGFIGHGPANGSSYGIMMGQWYASLSVLSWPSLLAGWLDQEDVVCIDARDGFQDSVIKINSLDILGAYGGIKSVVIRTGETTATVVEYRTDGKFSTLRPERHGVTVYNLDTSKPSNRCDSCGAQQYQDEKNWWNYIRIPNTFDGAGNNNVNFTKGVIPGTPGMTIEILSKNIVSIRQ